MIEETPKTLENLDPKLVETIRQRIIRRRQKSLIRYYEIKALPENDPRKIRYREVARKACKAWDVNNSTHQVNYLHSRPPEAKAKRAQYMKEYTTKNADELREYRKRVYILNRAEVLEKNKKWKRDNPEKAKALRTDAKRRDRARRKGAEGSYSIKDFEAKCLEFDNCCAYCGSREKLEPDHVVAISKGGTNYIDNIIPACHTCNVRKGNKPYKEFLEILRSEDHENVDDKSSPIVS